MRFVRTVLAALIALFALVGGLLVAAVIAVVSMLLMLFGRATGRVRVTTSGRSPRRPAGPTASVPVNRRTPAGEPVIDVVATEVSERR